MADAKFLVAGFLKRKFANVRQRLNTERFHFMPLNLEAFKMALNTAVDDLENVDAIYNGLVEHLKTRHGSNMIAISAVSSLKKDALKGSPALIYQGSRSNIVGVLYQGYNSAYESAFRGYLNKIVTNVIRTPFGNTTTTDSPADLLSSSRYEDTKYKKGFDVGHMYAGKDSEFGDTPLSYKLKILQDAINNLSNNKLVLAERTGVTPGSSKQASLDSISSQISSALQDLEDKSNVGIQVSTTLNKTITNNLAKVGAVIVLPQSRIENQLDYGTLIESVIEREISELLKTIRFSPTMLEEVHDRVVAPITKVKKSNVNASVDVGTFLVKSPVKTKVLSTISKKTTKTVSTPKVKSVAPDNTLSSLQALLDKHLQDVVSANMGGGSDRRVLNYRTGRLAASAKVERLTKSREGFITAYYTYMKNPYATFSDGGRQQYPRSRDPKLLISKSIREIAQTMAVNRLRAVVV